MTHGNGESVSPQRLTALPWTVWALAAGVVVLLLSVAGRYGFHRDELYFIAAGRRLAWGYVDQPPLTPLLARLGDILPGAVSPLSIRVLPALSAAAVIVVTALMAQRFGGGRVATSLAALFAAGGGFFLAVGHLLSTTTFDVLFWALVIFGVVALIDGADPRWWLAVGAVVGVGILNKYMIGFLVVAMVVGLLATPQRRLLATRWPWLGGVVALAVAAPNLVWQQANGWPQFEMAESLRAVSDGPVDYLLLQTAILSILLVIPAVMGWLWLWGDAVGRRWRALPIAFILLFVGFILTGGKGYYVAPLYLPLLAAGGLRIGALGRGRRTSLLAAIGTGIAFGLLLALPLVPPAAVNPFNEVNPELGETYAWDQVVDQVEVVYLGLPPDRRETAVIFTSNYGQAGAIEVLGSGRLPQPVSAHNSYWMWGPGERTGSIIGVGPVEGVLAPICRDLGLAAAIDNRAGVDNDERGQPIWVCANPLAPLAAVWDRARHYN